MSGSHAAAFLAGIAVSLLAAGGILALVQLLRDRRATSYRYAPGVPVPVRLPLPSARSIRARRDRAIRFGLRGGL